MTYLKKLVCVVLCGLAFPSWAKPELRVSAAISLKPVLDDVLSEYRESHPYAVYVDYGASGLMARRILQGAPADVFLSAGSEYLDKLATATLLLAPSRREIARGSLALVTPRDRGTVNSFADLVGPQVIRLAIGNPATVPLGAYAMDIFKHFGISEKIADRWIRASNARQVLAYVESGDVDAGIVYRSDAAGSSKVRIAAVADPKWHSPVRYEGAVLAASPAAKAASDFLDFLTSARVQQAFKRRGFFE